MCYWSLGAGVAWMVLVPVLVLRACNILALRVSKMNGEVEVHCSFALHVCFGFRCMFQFQFSDLGLGF
jgi:hypothetical protein